MKVVDIVIIGGGAAGLMAASIAAESGNTVVLIEKNYRCGSKLLITGKGRCNLTNTHTWEEFSPHIHPDSGFFKTAFFSFSNQDVISFFEKNGMATMVERGHRVFPVSEKSQDVLQTFLNTLNRENVEIKYNSQVSRVIRSDDGLFNTMFLSAINASKEKPLGDRITMDAILSKTVIVTTGGLSYPATGSTGDGYIIAKSFGHTISSTYPSLTALKPSKYDEHLVGITLKNINLTLWLDDNISQSEMGELTFTDGGIEGALGFRVSRKAVKAIIDKRKVELEIDLKPAVTTDELSKRITKDLADLLLSKRYSDYYHQGKIDTVTKALLRNMLPKELIFPFFALNQDLSLNNLPIRLKHWKFKIVNYVGYERAVVTSGGISLDEISRKTMESKKVSSLFFAGEVLNLDGDTGGYNLQIAFSTAFLAAKSASEKIKKLFDIDSK